MVSAQRRGRPREQKEDSGEQRGSDGRISRPDLQAQRPVASMAERRAARAGRQVAQMLGRLGLLKASAAQQVYVL